LRDLEYAKAELRNGDAVVQRPYVPQVT
jgi:hypothetical protein